MQRNIPSLKDKWKNHLQKRDDIFKPRPAMADKFCVAFFFYTLLALMFEILFIILPETFRSHSERHVKLFYTITVCVLFAQICINWFLTVFHKGNYVKTSTRDEKEENTSSLDTPSGWHTCPRCQLDAPPRSHHCTLCGTCVLKRDHHCFFTASCIGFRNQRRYIVFCFYSCIGTGLALYLQCRYLNHAMPLFSKHSLNYIIFIAAWRWITGALQAGLFGVLFHLYLTVFYFGASLFFFLWQIVVVCNGQTSHEAWKNIRHYQRDVWDNFQSVFGQYGLVHFIFPFPIEQEGDGITWDSAHRAKIN